MSTTEKLNLAMAIVFGFAVLVQGAYAVTYHLMARWEATAIGRALMSKALALLALLFMVFIVFIPGQFPGEEWIRLVVAVALLAALIVQFITMVKAQREVRSDEQDLGRRAGAPRKAHPST